MNNIPADIVKLIDSTTIVKLEDKQGTILRGENYSVSRFQKNQGTQVDLNKLEDYWKKKFKTLGNQWQPERQNYRFFYDTFKLFHISFSRLRHNKVQSINNRRSRSKLSYSDLAGTNLFGVYQYGKKCVDIIKRLGLFNAANSIDRSFLDKFSKTRNKLFEHNFNPKDMKLQIEPVLWSLASTDSWLDIHIHTQKESEYIAEIDYYEDYYRLENIITKIIKSL